LDFGIARTVDAQEGETLTATGSILGSPHYMSPEQIVSPKSVDERSDVWSLAIILYRLLANALPFEADSFGRLAILIAGDHPLSLVARRPDVPPALEKVLFRALEKDPNARYVNVGVFAAALAPYGTIRSMAAAAAPTNSLLAGGPTLAPHVPVPATATGSRVPSITANAMSLSGGSQTQVPPKSAAIPLLIGVAVVLLGALGVTAKVAFGRRDPAPPLTAVPTAPAPVSATIVPVPDNSVHPTVPSSTALPSVSAPPPAAVPPVAVATPAATPRPVATKTPEPAHTSPTHNPLDLGLKR
jgi:serine/threonine-protein kinase